MNSLDHYLEHKRPTAIGLPLVHVTPLSKFRQIAAAGHLVPQDCPVLRREILYCSYGDVVFRPSREETCWDVDPAVALILSPRLLNDEFTFAPLDTGAIASGRVPWFPNAARASLNNQYCVSDRGGQKLGAWVGDIYGSDERYIRRAVTSEQGSEPDEVVIARRLAQAVGDADIPDHTRDDMRVISQIECHLARPVSLDDYLLAAFLPGEEGLGDWAPAPGIAVRAYDGASIAGNLPTALVGLVTDKISEIGTRHVH